ncbi:MAG: DUF4352 domain-containing protein [Bryobacteraceae bacterium]|nr:DUF4352 domain-containing protein [Bryobacteraceae bacterium]
MKTNLLCGVLAAVLAATCSSGCSRPRSAKAAAMGETVGVGGVSYVVMDSQWRADLAGATGPRVPKNRFLVLRISATNLGRETINVPLLNLIDSKGNGHLEEQSGDGIEGWLGVLRTIAPGRTAEGAILFDVRPGEYNLEVVDGGDLENQQSRHIQIPYRIEEPVKVPSPGLPQ